MSETTHRSPTVQESLKEYGRGIIGGLLFSLPLLYTMEVWWTGFSAQPTHLLVYMTVTFLLLLAYNRFVGVHPGSSFREVLSDSIEEMGLGLLLSAGILFLLGQIHPGQDIHEIFGKIVVEGMTVAIGFSVGTAQLGGGDDEDSKEEEEQQEREPHFGGEMLLAVCGATLICANVAPTEEILKIAVESTEWRLFGIAVLSLMLCFVILEFSGFKGARRMSGQEFIPRFLFAGCISYAAALLSATFQLWFFRRLDDVSWIVALDQIIVLALPGALGASAGRLLLMQDR